MIPLMKHAFTNEYHTKKLLAEFITTTEKLSMGDKCFQFEKAFTQKQETKDAKSFYCANYPDLNASEIELIKNCLQKI